MHSLLPIKSFKITSAIVGRDVVAPAFATFANRDFPRPSISYFHSPRFVRAHPP